MQDTVLPGALLLCRRRFGGRRAEGTGSALFPGALSAVPEVGEGRVARLQGLEAKAVDGGLDPPAVPALDQRINPCARLPRRTRQAPGEKRVVLGLEPFQIRRELVQVGLNVMLAHHRIRIHMSGSHSSRA